MTPSDSCTARTSSSGCSPYAYGRFHGPAHWIVAPASSWRQWIEPRRVGVSSRPARRPSSTGDQGGRAVVVPIAASYMRFSCAYTRMLDRWQSFPWHGPIVVVVYRFASSIESKPSPMARFMSFVVTSSQMQTKHLPLPGYAGSGAMRERPSPVTLPTASMPSGSSVGRKTPSASSNSTRAPACASSEYAGWRPPEATTRSQP